MKLLWFCLAACPSVCCPAADVDVENESPPFPKKVGVGGANTGNHNGRSPGWAS